MYHRLRGLHRWIGLISSVFLLIISATGFLLATKGSFGWIRPPESEGAKIESLVGLVDLEKAANAAFALGIEELRTIKDIDRMDYRPKSNIYKIVSKEGYHEVQVDGATGKVLSVAYRTDQLSEDIHDMSFFAEWLHGYGLPVVAIGLLLLSVSGIVIFFVPIVRRLSFARKRARKAL